jgi:PAS domain S-box-containing protein
MKHRLLKRQIKKHLAPDIYEAGLLDDFIEAVDAAYKNYDSDYQQLERTLEISAKESFKELSDYKNAISITSMVVISDYKGKITYVNDNYIEASGYEKQELLGHYLQDFNSDFHRAKFYQQMHDTIRHGYVWKGEINDKTKSGGYYWVDTTIVPLLNSSGKPIKYITFKTDISKIKETEERYKKAKDEAEKALEIKAEFLSNMSHEIRTPMNAIIGLSDIILQEPLEPQVRDNLKSINQSADNLLVIINDILDFSKIEAGKVKIENTNFNFKYQLEHIKKTMTFKTDQKNLEFDVLIDEEIPKYLKGDPFRLNQVLLNLCGNAIKFTQSGSVKILVKLVKKDDKYAQVHFLVRDTGIGITEDRQKDIFESFTQADVKVTRQFGGTGLGLTITKQLIHLMGGEIQVSSQLGKGSDFFFDLNFEISTEGMDTPSNYSLIEKDLAGLSILVMEDNLINQKVIRQILNKWNCKVSIAGNGNLGLEQLKKHHFDLLLMDLQMPVMDGYETTKAIRTGVVGIHYLRVPIIALTADAFPETKKKVLEWGMNDLVSKPFRKAILNDRIFQMAKHYCPEKLSHLDNV